MKKIARSIIAVLLSALTVIPTALSAAPAVKTEAAKTVDVHTVDLSSGLTMSGSYMALADFQKEIAAGTIAAGTNGSYKFAKAPDGTPALELSYSPMKGQPNFRFMPYMIDAKPGKDYKYVRIEYMTEDLAPAQITVINNAVGTEKAVLIADASVSKGQWIATPPASIDIGGLLDRIARGAHITIGVDSATDSAKYYIRKIHFFKTAEDAYAYFGDSADDYGQTVFPLTLAGADVTGKPLQNAEWGNFTVNNENGSVDITYAEKTNFSGYNYMLKMGFTSKSFIVPEAKYARIYYSAKNPAGVTGGSLILRNDAADERAIFVENLTDTNGYVLSDTVEIPAGIMERFSATGKYTSCMHNTLKVKNVNVAGGEYSVKAIYFFTSKEKADAFKLPGSESTVITVAGNSIDTYAIVTPAEKVDIIEKAVAELASHVEALTGTALPVYSDGECPDHFNKIYVGKTSSDASKEAVEMLEKLENPYNRYAIRLADADIVINGVHPFAVADAVSVFMTSYLYYGSNKNPETVDITKLDYNGISAEATLYDGWNSFTNVALPEVFTEDFDTDDGYFAEEYNADSFVISGGVMTAKAYDSAVTYVHVYEPNATVSADLTASAVTGDSQFGLMLRYTSDDAWLKAGYSASEGKFYVASREGTDFYTDITYGDKFDLKGDKAYRLTFSSEGENAVLKVDGKTAVTMSGISHVTPGRVGVYADSVKLTVDNFELSLDSGEGVIWQNVTHYRIPGDEYMEGGTVIELTDGSLIYTHHSGTTYKSQNGGRTWEKTERFAQSYGYTNIMRLNNGELMQIATVNQGGVNYWCSRTSADDGKTWVNGGIICDTHYKGDPLVSAGNMNDKLFQSATTGRIFYSQNYEVRSGGTPANGNYVFCEFYYSDDNGKTWQKSDTDSWEIEGNKDTHFGECKMLECADGTIRVYSSWNSYDCVVYADSTDGGKTFGPIVELTDLPCSRSSVQFVRDPYADSDTTYYMVWVNSHDNKAVGNMPRQTLSLAKSTDGKSWEFLGDVWRWQFNYNNDSGYNSVHAVDPFINVTENEIIVGAGISEHFPTVGTNGGHGSQRQHVWRIEKDTLPEGTPVRRPGNLYDFTDVSTRDSYYEAVKFAVDNGLFNGTSATTFDPLVTMNRAMFVTVLGRLDKADVSKYTTPTFDDVKAGEWYTSYVEWAAANGIVNGMGNGVYGVTGTVTVEQALTILYRYANGKNAANGSGKSVADFTDASKISSWASDGVKWAVENGIYDGVAGRLNPTDAASRATVATMFANYVKIFG